MGSGERLNGIQEVSGSIPLISTKSPEVLRFQDFFLCLFGFNQGYRSAACTAGG